MAGEFRVGDEIDVHVGAAGNASVQLFKGTDLVGEQPVVDGLAVFQLGELPAGEHTFTARGKNASGEVSDPTPPAKLVLMDVAPTTPNSITFVIRVRA